MQSGDPGKGYEKIKKLFSLTILSRAKGHQWEGSRREEIWQGSTGCSLKEATVLYSRNHPAGMKPIKNSETRKQENIHKYLIFETCAFFSHHAPNMLHNSEKLLKDFLGDLAVLSPRALNHQYKIHPKLEPSLVLQLQCPTFISTRGRTCTKQTVGQGGQLGPPEAWSS